MFIAKASFPHLILKFVLAKFLQAGLLYYDKYLDTLATLNKMIQGLYPCFIVSSFTKLMVVIEILLHLCKPLQEEMAGNSRSY